MRAITFSLNAVIRWLQRRHEFNGLPHATSAGPTALFVSSLLTFDCNCHDRTMHRGLAAGAHAQTTFLRIRLAVKSTTIDFDAEGNILHRVHARPKGQNVTAQTARRRHNNVEMTSREDPPMSETSFGEMLRVGTHDDCQNHDGALHDWRP